MAPCLGTGEALRLAALDAPPVFLLVISWYVSVEYFRSFDLLFVLSPFGPFSFLDFAMAMFLFRFGAGRIQQLTRNQ